VTRWDDPVKKWFTGGEDSPINKDRLTLYIDILVITTRTVPIVQLLLWLVVVLWIKLPYHPRRKLLVEWHELILFSTYRCHHHRSTHRTRIKLIRIVTQYHIRPWFVLLNLYCSTPTMSRHRCRDIMPPLNYKRVPTYRYVHMAWSPIISGDGCCGGGGWSSSAFVRCLG
jgi:hypothetical protein